MHYHRSFTSQKNALDILINCSSITSVFFTKNRTLWTPTLVNKFVGLRNLSKNFHLQYLSWSSYAAQILYEKKSFKRKTYKTLPFIGIKGFEPQYSIWKLFNWNSNTIQTTVILMLTTGKKTDYLNIFQIFHFTSQIFNNPKFLGQKTFLQAATSPSNYCMIFFLISHFFLFIRGSKQNSEKANWTKKISLFDC